MLTHGWFRERDGNCMGRYTIIADTSEKLIEMLQKELVPDIIQNENEIGLRSPEERSDVSLGLYLYDITESEEIKTRSTAVIKNDRILKPPVYLNLYYMLTAYARGDNRYRLSQEEKILGRVIQTFLDYPMIVYDREDQTTEEGEGRKNTETRRGQEIPMIQPRIIMQRLDSDERNKIWNFTNTSYRLSLFYKVSPVAIDSNIGSAFTRVREADFGVKALSEIYHR